MNSPGKLKRSRSPADFRRRAREYAFLFRAGFSVWSKETTAAQQADMATAIKLQVAVGDSDCELRLFR
jgi:hypothetical protein